MLIFGLLSNILQLHNINSNLQLVLKGLIIIGTVLVQERNAREIFVRFRLALPGLARSEASREERPPKETMSLNTGGNGNETS